jgi:hypothetical protein
VAIFDVTKDIVTIYPTSLCGNITCINTDEGLIFVDAGLVVKETTKFRQDMEKRFNKETIYLILTHHPY